MIPPQGLFSVITTIALLFIFKIFLPWWFPAVGKYGVLFEAYYGDTGEREVDEVLNIISDIEGPLVIYIKCK